MSKLAFACVGLLSLTFTACASWAASTPVDVCGGPVDYVEIALGTPQDPVDALMSDAGTVRNPVWTNIDNPSQYNVLCYPNGGIKFIAKKLPTTAKTCQFAAASGEKRTLLCQ